MNGDNHPEVEKNAEKIGIILAKTEKNKERKNKPLDCVLRGCGLDPFWELLFGLYRRLREIKVVIVVVSGHHHLRHEYNL